MLQLRSVNYYIFIYIIISIKTCKQEHNCKGNKRLELYIIFQILYIHMKILIYLFD